ncbi:hypothetical protein KIN20_037496 [Parelaphostrongylus tenuis]|uniref:Uncharacterized protein n=1 Tax=Parelaphostrongylus tenuis TaxID=148309 RepID=A0AAD5WM38_PARTN|nr:hypothetical protein KIN20_037496 [Parelaphostrongylus tenuis]
MIERIYELYNVLHCLTILQNHFCCNPRQISAADDDIAERHTDIEPELSFVHCWETLFTVQSASESKPCTLYFTWPLTESVKPMSSWDDADGERS